MPTPAPTADKRNVSADVSHRTSGGVLSPQMMTATGSPALTKPNSLLPWRRVMSWVAKPHSSSEDRTNSISKWTRVAPATNGMLSATPARTSISATIWGASVAINSGRRLTSLK